MLNRRTHEETLEEYRTTAPRRKVGERLSVADGLDLTDPDDLITLAGNIHAVLAEGKYDSIEWNCDEDGDGPLYYSGYRPETDEAFLARTQTDWNDFQRIIKRNKKNKLIVDQILALNPDVEYSTDGPIARTMETLEARTAMAKAMWEPVKATLSPRPRVGDHSVYGYFYQKGTNVQVPADDLALPMLA